MILVLDQFAGEREIQWQEQVDLLRLIMQRQSSLGSKPNRARSKAYSNSIHLYLSVPFFLLSDDLS